MHKQLRVLFICAMACLTVPGRAETPAPPAKAAVTGTPLMPCAKPLWPKISLRNSEQGTVTMELLVAPTGVVRASRVSKSSGFALLDAAALEATAKCKFEPVQEKGQAVEAWITTEYVWAFQ
jgi:bla regulator protein BlaR1